MPEAKKAAPKKKPATKPAAKASSNADLERRVAQLEQKLDKLANHPSLDKVSAQLDSFEDKLRAWLMDAPLIKIGAGVLVVILLILVF